MLRPQAAACAQNACLRCQDPDQSGALGGCESSRKRSKSRLLGFGVAPESPLCKKFDTRGNPLSLALPSLCSTTTAYTQSHSALHSRKSRLCSHIVHV